MTSETTTAKVEIFGLHRDAALAKLEKLARRAARYGQAISWTERPFIQTVERVRWDGKRVKVDIPRVEFTLTGDAPRVGEFKFLAQLEQAPGGVLVSAISGVEIGDLGFGWDGRCEHCGSKRYRRQAFVVEGPDGTRKVVGKSCLRDYLGTDSPEKALWTFTFLDEVKGLADEESGYGGYGRWEESTIGVIAAARAAIALWGWRPASHEGITTAMHVDLALNPCRMRTHDGKDPHEEERAAIRRELKERGEHYQETAAKVIEWGRQMEGRSDYERNLKVALNADYVVGKTLNLVISAAAAYDRQVAREDERKRQREAEEARKAALPPSYHVGQPGDRVTTTVTLERVIVLPDYGWGPSRIYVLRADDGAVLSWKTGTSAPRLDDKPMEVGDRAVVTATVKEHREFRDTAETRVQRPKFAPAEEKEAA
jgi:hypothetical protein